MLILSRTKNTAPSKHHGLEYKGSKIIVKKTGLFPNFHSCYSKDPSIHEEGYSFKLESLMNQLPIRENDLNGMLLREGRDCLLVKIREENSGQEVVVHELDREFLFTFAISSLSRYQVVEWTNMIKGLKSDLIIEIQRYMQSIQVFFPLLVVSYILKRKLIPEFYPATVNPL
jgi:hypothetical protein